MKHSKFLSLLATTLILSLSATGCSKKDGDVRTLVIYNWQDYIFEGDEETDSIIDQFIESYFEETGEKINVEYYTFETNENMYNILQTGKSKYDLVCPSDYMIQKMIKENMLHKLNKDNITNCIEYISPYITELFDNNKIDNGNETVSWSDYAVPYFWGTMGFMYDPELVDEEDVASWSVLWNENYKGMSTLKDSVRDTYVAGVMYAYTDLANPKVGHSLNELKDLYDNGTITQEEYTNSIQVIMNDTSDETVELVKNALNDAKENVYGFEVDSGKADIVTGKIAINFCWSGDAVYAMDCAEEESDVYLNYSLPIEGSNVWFDGWVMPENGEDGNYDLAEAFLNFISQPEIAAINMNEVGYTNSVAGEDIYQMVIDWYGAYEDEEDPEAPIVYEYDEENEVYNIVMSQEEIDELVANEELYAYDLGYFFGDTIEGDGIVYSTVINRQFSAQFPTKDEIARCAVMEDFGADNEKVLEMWVQVKGNKVPAWAYIFVVAVVFVIAFFAIYKYTEKKSRKARIKLKKATNN